MDSYKVFCEEIVQKRIIDNEEIMRMKKLLQMFVNYVKKIQDLDASKYTTKLLKQKLQKDYPQLQFHTPHKRNASEFVYVESLQTSSLFDRLPSSSETGTETSMTETETESDASPKEKIPDVPSDTTQDTDSTRFLYHSGIILLNAIRNVPSMSSLWPPTADSFTLAMVPTILFNFLACCTGASAQIDTTRFIDVDKDLESKLLSICQDLIYLSHNGRKQTPKSLSLALTAKHVTGSARFLTILNRYGDCSSHDTVLSLETALAHLELQSESQIPKGFQKHSSTILVWDNIDFREETSSGHGTTHHTNGIMLQSEISETIEDRTLSISKSLRTFKPQSSTLDTYVLHKRVGPQSVGLNLAIEEKHYEQVLLPARIKDFAYILCKIVDEGVYSVLSWTGFNTVMQTEPLLSKSAINYLPVISASPTEMGTVKTIFTRSLEIADRFELTHVILVFDQAIYSKAQQISWKDENLQKRTVIRMGEFHTCMSFCGVLGKRFRDAGLQDVLIESGVIAHGSIETMLNGHHYNRSIRGHKLMFEALQQLRFQSFIDSLPDNEADNIKTVVNTMWSSYPESSLMDMLQSDECQNLMQQYKVFISERSEDNPTFAIWSSYIEMVQLLLMFIRATHESDWNLHLAALRCMMPWFFSYDRMNYSRYLPAYWMEMINLPETHPECHSDFLEEGNGLFTQRRNILEKNSIKKDAQAVKAIIGTIQSMVNPFDLTSELVGISTGAVASPDVKNDMLCGKEKGATALNEFMNDRLINQKVDIFSPIKSLKLKTFSDLSKQKSSKTKSGKEVSVKNDRQFFGRLLIIAQNREINLKEVLSYSLGPVSYPLSLAKTNKSALLDAIESEVKDIYVDTVPDNAALIIDGMALIQSLKKIPDTFAELSDSILAQVIIQWLA